MAVELWRQRAASRWDTCFRKIFLEVVEKWNKVRESVSMKHDET